MSNAQLLLLRRTYHRYARSKLKRRIELAKEMNVDHDVASKWYNFHRWKKRNLTKESLSLDDIKTIIQRKYEIFTIQALIYSCKLCYSCTHVRI